MFYLDLAQIVISVILILLVILQMQDNGMYSSFSNINRTKRGSEKLIFRFTIFLIATMLVISAINFYL